jgi:hypothetical protein
MSPARAGLPAETRHATPFAVLSIITDGAHVTGIRYLPRSCHRVLAAGGRLGGFMGGREDFPLAVKRWLLRHEGILAAAD